MRNISFQLRAGEILGVSGLMGAGRSELARILFGLDPCASGEVRLADERVDHLPPRQRIRRGLAFLTEDRRLDGLCAETAIADNLTLIALPGLCRRLVGWVDGAGVRQAIGHIREAVRLTPAARTEQAVKTLSGGNQQKVVLAAVVLAAHLVLTRTPFGRQIYAVGADGEAARKAGIRTRRVLLAVYVICGLCAAIAGIVALSQAPAVSPSFGNNREFMAIAAAVLGGTSLFGGRGAVFPGTVLGAVLIQTIENGLTILNVDPYLYPLITSAVIFVAVLVDATRCRVLAWVNRKRIYVEA